MSDEPLSKAKDGTQPLPDGLGLYPSVPNGGDSGQIREVFEHLQRYVQAHFVNGTTRDADPSVAHAYLLLKRIVQESAAASQSEVSCEACEAGMRLADHIHYDDARGGSTWGVCRKYVAEYQRKYQAAVPPVVPPSPEGLVKHEPSSATTTDCEAQARNQGIAAERADVGVARPDTERADCDAGETAASSTVSTVSAAASVSALAARDSRIEVSRRLDESRSPDGDGPLRARNAEHDNAADELNDRPVCRTGATSSVDGGCGQPAPEAGSNPADSHSPVRPSLAGLIAQWRNTAVDLQEKAERLDRLREPERACKLQARADQLESDAHELSAILRVEDITA